MYACLVCSPSRRRSTEDALQRGWIIATDRLLVPGEGRKNKGGKELPTHKASRAAGHVVEKSEVWMAPFACFSLKAAASWRENLSCPVPRFLTTPSTSFIHSQSKAHDASQFTFPSKKPQLYDSPAQPLNTHKLDLPRKLVIDTNGPGGKATHPFPSASRFLSIHS